MAAPSLNPASASPSPSPAPTINADGSDEQPVLLGAYGTPKWSPDATWLAVYAEKAASVVPALVRPDGSDYRELALPAGLSCGQAAWSPSGAQLAVECWSESDESQNGVWLISSADGSDPVQLVHARAIPGAFSPDGRMLVFGRVAPDDTVQPALINVDGSGELVISDENSGPMPGFMPGGASVYVVVGGVIEVRDLSGARVATVAAPESKIYEALLSPDGGWFAIEYDPPETRAPGVYRLAIDGTGLGVIVNSNIAGSEEVHPDWMPRSAT